MAKNPQTVSVAGKPLACLICGNGTFDQRTIKMNTTGMALFELDAFNKGADTAICSSCGYLHSFASKDLAWSD